MKKILFTLVALGSTFAFASCGAQQAFDTSKNITCYTRDTTSGTRDGFFTKIGLEDAKDKNEPLVEGIVEASSNDDMVTKIKNDTYGIGYISLASYDAKKVKGLTYNEVIPSEENVLNNSYQLTRNFNYLVRSEFSNNDVRDIVTAFVAFLSTKDAKLTIKGNDGIITINDSDPTWDNIKSSYPICNKDNSSITVKFGGSTSCDKIARALSSEFSAKCGNFIAEHNHTGSGDAYKRCQGSEKDTTNYLDIGFASREFKLTSSEPAAENTYGLICVDAIVAVVNLNNPLEKVSDNQLVDIYSGVLTKWSELL
ncbi:MAG: substrate-binding domain-containing protein [Traorella sp.]